jgi:phosphoribosylaminoimidazolecarboxamide formyltransferase/IMP cyclohydrolase
MTIKQALISVSDKTGVLEFAQGLAAQGVNLLSTGGTAKMLRDAGLTVTEIGDYTGFPEMLDGRVKTLHPKVHGGILARRDLPEHLATIAAHGIPTIDLVCVNLYPFAATIAKAGVTLEDAIENIDIGGPAMVRSSAKNYNGVAIVTDPEDYAPLLAEMQANGGALQLATRFGLAKKAFTHTARYDSMIANWLTGLDEGAEAKPAEAAPIPAIFPARLQLAFDRTEILRYGENSHQSAAFYRETNPVAGSIAAYTQLQGKELSYNNIADSDAAWECVKSFDAPACVIVKHANPCGVAIDGTLLGAYEKSFKTDSTSAFGGIIAFNGEVGIDVVNAMNERKHFVEVLIAPSFTAEAKAALVVQAKSARPRRADFPRAEYAGIQARRRRPAGPDPGRLHSTSLRPEDRHQGSADCPADRRPALRRARRQVRQVQRHRLLRQRHDARRRGRTDEPCRFDQDRQHQGAARRSRPERFGRRFGRLLPVP